MVVAPVKTKPDERAKELAFSLVFETDWTEEAYLALSELNRPIELSEGRMTVHDLPTPEHQRIVRRLSRLFEGCVTEREAAEILFAPVPIRLWPGKFREPDIMVYLAENRQRIGEQFGEPPDLVIEVLSPTRQHLDRGIKFNEYAMAGVREYWLADPETSTLQVFSLRDEQFVSLGESGPGQTAQSVLLPDCRISTDEVFAL